VLENSVLPACASYCGHLIQSSVLGWYHKGQFRIESSISKDGLYTLSWGEPRRESLSFSENTVIIQVRERTDERFFLRFRKIMKANWLLTRNNFMHFLADWNYKVQKLNWWLKFFFFFLITMEENWVLFGLSVVKLSKREVWLMGCFNIHECDGSAFSPVFPPARPLINDHLYKWNISLSETIFFFARS